MPDIVNGGGSTRKEFPKKEEKEERKRDNVQRTLKRDPSQAFWSSRSRVNFVGLGLGRVSPIIPFVSYKNKRENQDHFLTPPFQSPLPAGRKEGKVEEKNEQKGKMTVVI
jgi:hypothetical protein